MANEQSWVKTWVRKLDSAIQTALPKYAVHAEDQHPLLYSYEVGCYRDGEPDSLKKRNYKTDILIWDELDQVCIPRVVIETKLEKVSSHDALTYSAKAATHKQVHPFLRYGILIGRRGDKAIPGRLFLHGAHFDFMTTWSREKPSPSDWSKFVKLVCKEIKASRAIETFLSQSRKKNRQRFSVIHRQLVMK